MRARDQLLFFIELIASCGTRIANLAANVAESTRSQKFLYTDIKESSRDLTEEGLSFNSHARHIAHHSSARAADCRRLGG
jgi:hypothetical protein